MDQPPRRRADRVLWNKLKRLAYKPRVLKVGGRNWGCRLMTGFTSSPSASCVAGWLVPDKGSSVLARKQRQDP